MARIYAFKDELLISPLKDAFSYGSPTILLSSNYTCCERLAASLICLMNFIAQG
jgi:hypothetical protein